MNGNEARGLIPPRPNPGPEPWREPAGRPGYPVAIVIALAAVVLMGWFWRRRSVAQRARRAALAARGAAAAEPTPRERLVGLSESIRDALTVQFGSVCRARTTEELSTDLRLVQLLGEEDFRELIRFLDRIDLLKFAPARSDNHAEVLGELLAAWEPRVATLGDRLRVKSRGRARSAFSPPGGPIATNSHRPSGLDRRDPGPADTPKTPGGRSRSSSPGGGSGSG